VKMGVVKGRGPVSFEPSLKLKWAGWLNLLSGFILVFGGISMALLCAIFGEYLGGGYYTLLMII